MIILVLRIKLIDKIMLLYTKRINLTFNQFELNELSMIKLTFYINANEIVG